MFNRWQPYLAVTLQMGNFDFWQIGHPLNYSKLLFFGLYIPYKECIFFKLEYSCFTMLCQFLLYSKVNRLYVKMQPCFWISLPFRSSQSTEQFPELYSRFSLVTYFIYVHMSIQFLFIIFCLPLLPKSSSRTMLRLNYHSHLLTAFLFWQHSSNLSVCQPPLFKSSHISQRYCLSSLK